MEILRILHVNSYYAVSGAPSFYKNLFEKQISEGLDVTVFVPISYEIGPIKKEQFGKYSLVVKTHNQIDRYLFHLKQGKIVAAAKRMFHATEFDIVHAHSLFTNGYVAYKLKQKFGIPYIVAIRNTDINIFLRYMPFLKGIGLKILLDAEKCVFINKPYLERIINTLIPSLNKQTVLEKSLVLPNGIDSFWLRNKNPKERKVKNQRLRVLTVGQVNRNKNHLVVAKSLEMLIARGYEITYQIIGEIKDEKIFALLKKYPFVEYFSPRPKEELISFYRDADIFVLPSKTETFGLVYAEAMSQGLPVIYSKGEGFDEQFEEGVVGYHVESNNINEVSSKIIRIIKNYQIISSNCIQLCDRFNWEMITEVYRRIYYQCCEARVEK